MSKEIATITKQDLTYADSLQLTDKQLNVMLKKTPDRYVHERPAKGGGNWKYVTGGYVKKVLNLMFGFNWDFEIVSEMIQHGQAIVKGKLTCRTGDITIVKMQYGRQDIKFKRGTTDPLDLGNDLKGAATDALKKCASELGVASDIYNAEEFKELTVVNVDEKDKLDRVKQLFNDTKAWLSPDYAADVQRIIDNREAVHYDKVIKEMESIDNDVTEGQ